MEDENSMEKEGGVERLGWAVEASSAAQEGKGTGKEEKGEEEKGCCAACCWVGGGFSSYRGASAAATWHDCSLFSPLSLSPLPYAYTLSLCLCLSLSSLSLYNNMLACHVSIWKNMRVLLN